MKTWLKYGLRTLGIVVGLEIVLLIVGGILNIFIDNAFFFLNFPFFIAIQFLAIKVLSSEGVMWSCAGPGCYGSYYSIGNAFWSSLLLLLIIFILGSLVGLIVRKIKS